MKLDHGKLLRESFNGTKHQLSGHGRRNVSVLKEAFANVDGETSSDMYGKGEVIEAFERKMAQLLGKESTVFFPSGTMAQQIALRIWCDELGTKKVAYHPLAHLEIHEEDGLKELHGIETVLLADETRLVELADVVAMEDVSCLLLELPQREIGGQLPSFETLEAIASHCKARGIKLHLDGARLLEILPYYGKSASEVCELFDSVYLSFYKGIGGIAGAILAGSEGFTERSKVWKRRHGGDLISLYPYILSADHYYEKRKDRMASYYEDAKQLAERFNAVPGIRTMPNVPVSNMFHLHITGSKEEIATKLAELQRSTGIGVAGYLVEKNGYCSTELSLGDAYRELDGPAIDHLFTELDRLM